MASISDGRIQTEHQLEKALCPNCGSCCSILFKAHDLNRKTTSEQFSYFRCSTCGLVHELPIPSNLADYYPCDYPQHALPQSLNELQQRAKDTSSRVAFVQQFVSRGKLLEVGAGYGAFSYMAQQSGFEVDAIEMDASCCRYLEKLGVRALCSASVNAVDNMLGEFDVIAMWHVIEHLEDYKTVLKILTRHLAPGGVLIVCAPNPNSLQFRLLGRYWVGLDAPRHLQLIPITVLGTCAEQDGLEIVFASASDPEALVFNKWCWQASIDHFFVSAGLMPQSGFKSIIKTGGGVRKFLDVARRLAFKSLSLCIARLLSILLAPLERSGNRGTSYSVVLKRGGSPNSNRSIAKRPDAQVSLV